MKVKKGKVITLTSSKGGIGKTIFITNLAGTYDYLEKKTLLIDLDLYTGGVSTLLDLAKAKTIYNLVDDFINNRFANIDDYVVKYSENLDILPACKDPRQGAKIAPKYIEQIIEIYRGKYEVILIDTNHIPLPSNLLALDLSDTILYMVSNDPLDLANSKSTMAIFKDTGKDNIKVILNNSFDISKKYFSMFDIKNVLHTNIDYVLDKSLYINDIDKYIMDGKILVLNNKLSFNHQKDKDLMISIAKKLSEDKDEESK